MGQWPELVTDEFARTYWLFQSGQTVPAIFGAEDDDTDDDTDDKDDDDKDKSKSTSDSDDDDDDDEDEDDDKEDDKPDKIRDRMRAADRRASQLEKELADMRKERKAREDAEKTDLERAQGRVSELEADIAKKDKALRNLQVQLAFFSVNDVDWVDPSEAVGALDLSEVEIDDSGKVNKKALRKAIKTLAAEKEHWVKKDSDTSGQGPSGSRMNGKRKGEGDKPDRAKLAADFPALNNRV